VSLSTREQAIKRKVARRAPVEGRRIPSARKDRRKGRFVLVVTMALCGHEFVSRRHYKTREQAENVKTKMLKEHYRSGELTILDTDNEGK
jgi:hypothetical protein